MRHPGRRRGDSLSYFCCWVQVSKVQNADTKVFSFLHRSKRTNNLRISTQTFFVERGSSRGFVGSQQEKGYDQMASEENDWVCVSVCV